MREWKERCVILRYGHFREADLWVKVLFRESGLHTLFAFGGARSKHRFCGCLDQLNILDCRTRASGTGNYLSMEEASLVSSPVNLRQDWRKMGVAVNCARFVEACGIGPETAPECYAVTEDMLRWLESDKTSTFLAPLFFRLRFAAALGYSPDFSSCVACGKEILDWGYFLVSEGRMLCPGCGLHGHFPLKRHGMKLSRPAIDLLENVKHNLPAQWPEELPDDADSRRAARAIDGFAQFHLGLKWNKGAFRKI